MLVIETRNQVLHRDGWHCMYCGTRLFAKVGQAMVDHVAPSSKGGTDDPSNLLAACSFCNASKHARDLDYLRLRLALRGSKYEGVMPPKVFIALSEMGELTLPPYAFHFERMRDQIGGEVAMQGSISRQSMLKHLAEDFPGVRLWGGELTDISGTHGIYVNGSDTAPNGSPLFYFCVGAGDGEVYEDEILLGFTQWLDFRGWYFEIHSWCDLILSPYYAPGEFAKLNQDRGDGGLVAGAV